MMKLPLLASSSHPLSSSSSAIAPLVLKDDDEEEPALPPENPEQLAKVHDSLASAPPPTARRKRRNKKHGRSVSLIGDEDHEHLLQNNPLHHHNNNGNHQHLMVPMSARGPSPQRKTSFGAFPNVPRLSIASPWSPSDTPTRASTSYVPGGINAASGVGAQGSGGSGGASSSSFEGTSGGIKSSGSIKSSGGIKSSGSFGGPIGVSSNTYASMSTDMPASAASTSELANVGSGGGGGGVGSGSGSLYLRPSDSKSSLLRRNPHSESALSDLTNPSSIDSDSLDFGSMTSARSSISDKDKRAGSGGMVASGSLGSIQSAGSGFGQGHHHHQHQQHHHHQHQHQHSHNQHHSSNIVPATLVHRSGRASSESSAGPYQVQPSPRSRTMFEEALEQSQSYSTSIDSLSPDNYQISLTSVNSGDDDEMPEHIMSAAALARIKGQMKKSSSSVRANDVFNPILESVSESSDDSMTASPSPAAKRHSVFSVFHNSPSSSSLPTQVDLPSSPERQASFRSSSSTSSAGGRTHSVPFIGGPSPLHDNASGLPIDSSSQYYHGQEVDHHHHHNLEVDHHHHHHHQEDDHHHHNLEQSSHSTASSSPPNDGPSLGMGPQDGPSLDEDY